MKYLLLIFTWFCCAHLAHAQVYQKEVKGGNSAYENKNFADAEVNYKRATVAKPEGVEGFFNLGDALYKQGRYDEALEAYQKAGNMTTNPSLQAKIMHNVGNIYREKKQPKEAAEAYKSALRLNPNDDETRYNLAKTLRELKAQEQQNQDNKDDKKDQNKDDQKKDDNKNQDKKDQKDGQDPNKKEPPKDDKSDQQKESDKNQDAKKNEDQQKKEGQGDKPDKEPQPNEQGEKGEVKKMNPEEMKRLVEAAENAERQTRTKVNAQLKKKVKAKTKATEKDW